MYEESGCEALSWSVEFSCVSDAVDGRSGTPVMFLSNAVCADVFEHCRIRQAKNTKAVLCRPVLRRMGRHPFKLMFFSVVWIVPSIEIWSFAAFAGSGEDNALRIAFL